METQKKGRIESTIQKELGKIIKRDLDVDPKIFITVTQVEYFADNRQAAVKISVFPEDQQQKIVALLNRSAKMLVKALQKRIRMGHIPALFFKYDPSIIHNDQVQQLIAKNEKSG